MLSEKYCNFPIVIVGVACFVNRTNKLLQKRKDPLFCESF